MFQDNPLLAQLKQQLRDNIPKKEGVVRGSDRGFGFLETDNRESYFIPPQQMKKVMHGDRITALIRTENEKEQAEPDSLITPFLTRFVGRIKLIKDRLNVVPDHPVLKEVIKARPIKGLDEKQFAEGDWVVANLQRHGLTDGSHCAEISERITAGDDPGTVVVTPSARDVDGWQPPVTSPVTFGFSSPTDIVSLDQPAPVKVAHFDPDGDRAQWLLWEHRRAPRTGDVPGAPT